MSVRKSVVVALALGVLAAPGAAYAQAAKVPRIGLLRFVSRDAPDPAAEGFRQGLREHGRVDGQNIHIEYRWAEGRAERVPALVAELVRLNVDVIVTGGEQAILAAKRATSTIPIVMGASNDPVGAGLVASLGRPGGNVTGMAVLSPELSRKRLQLLKEVLPRASRVAVLSNPGYPGTARDLAETRSAAQELGGLTLQNVEIRSPADFEAALAAVAQRADALILLGDPFFTAHRTQLAALAAKHRIPAVYYWKEFVEGGGLMSYGPNLRDLYRRAATHVDKILKGARPADLPVEQPTTFELAINLKTAQAFNLAFPQPVLARADHVIR
ncbi:MAG: ABC transporter substrate-binding protein [Candidatus Rokuibacteriota bacterium]